MQYQSFPVSYEIWARSSGTTTKKLQKDGSCCGPKKLQEKKT